MQFNSFKNQFSNQPRVSPLKVLQDFFSKPHPLNRTLLFLAICFVLTHVVTFYMYLFSVPLKLGETEYSFFIRYVALPDSETSLFEMPWTLFTHVLAQTGFFSLMFHLIVLSVFGKLFFDYWGSRRFFLLLSTASLAGAATFVYSGILFTSSESVNNQMLVGAGAPVFALMAYMFVYLPQHNFVHLMLKIKMRYVIIFIIVIDLLFYNADMPGIHFSHLGGAVFGAAFGMISKFLVRRRASRPVFRVSKKKPKTRKYQPYEPVKTKTDEEYQFIKKQRQDRIDQILDKISQSGYSSLTKEEKDFLFHESKK
jgi:membrane associated rhomboid family serine protease